MKLADGSNLPRLDSPDEFRPSNMTPPKAKGVKRPGPLGGS